jgi:hypothetical protein
LIINGSIRSCDAGRVAPIPQTFAACFLMPASKVRAIIEKEFGRRPIFSDRYKLLHARIR